MSTADLLPSGARTILGSTFPQAAGHFVAFTAQPAAGRTNLLESDLTSNTITRIVSDNDPAFASAGGPPSNTVVAPNFFLNESGQVAFETVGANAAAESSVFLTIPGAPAVNQTWLDLPTTCGTIYLWSPSSGLAKVAAAYDTAPNSTVPFSCVVLNSAPPSPLNRTGEVAFSSPSFSLVYFPCSSCGNPFTTPPPTVVNGDFLYRAPGMISEIAAAGDTLPGESLLTASVPSLSVPTNSGGQVAFGAELDTWGFYLRNGDATQKVMADGDTVPGSSGATFGFPHFIAGLADNGNFAFTAATSGAADGLFLAPAGAAIQTLALDGGAAPVSVGGTFSLTSTGLIVPNPPTGTIPVGFNSFKNFAAINGESDVAFGASITGGSADSGIFRVLQSGPAAGSLQPVVLQGQAAPGGGTFSTINLLSNLGANFALGPDGALAFVNLFTDTSGTKQGMFVARPDGTLLKVAATGDFAPVPGGGVLAGFSMSPRLAAGDAGKFAFEAGIFGGSTRRAVFVTSIPPGTASTTTTLSPLQSPVVAQEMVTLAASVSSAAGTPTGTVTFFANGISLGTRLAESKRAGNVDDFFAGRRTGFDCRAIWRRLQFCAWGFGTSSASCRRVRAASLEPYRDSGTEPGNSPDCVCPVGFDHEFHAELFRAPREDGLHVRHESSGAGSERDNGSPDTHHHGEFETAARSTAQRTPCAAGLRTCHIACRRSSPWAHSFGGERRAGGSCHAHALRHSRWRSRLAAAAHQATVRAHL